MHCNNSLVMVDFEVSEQGGSMQRCVAQCLFLSKKKEQLLLLLLLSGMIITVINFNSVMFIRQKLLQCHIWLLSFGDLVKDIFFL